MVQTVEGETARATVPAPSATATSASGVALGLARDDVRAIWRGSRAWAMGVVLLAFPLLFILDKGTAWPVSPVLPGLAILAVVLVLLPFPLAEVAARLARRRDVALRQAKARRYSLQGRILLVAAAVWVALWFVLGA